MPLHISSTEEEVLRSLADYIAATAKESIAANRRFLFVLSGGNSPKKLFSLLVADYKEKIDWSKVFFFFGDERYVPQTHPESNYLMAKNTLFDPLQISGSNVFAFNTELDPVESAQQYQQTLKDFFGEKDWRFDLALLGLGDNAHTASLFPHTEVLKETTPGVTALFIDEVNMYRLTLNAPLINKAKHIAFLVYGRGKALAMHHILEGEKNIDEFPAQLIDKKADWFADKEAAAELRQ